MRRREIRERFGHLLRADGPYLYVAELSSGVIKVGTCWVPHDRLGNLSAVIRADGATLLRASVQSVKGRHPFFWEARLIEACLRIGNRVHGREWFGSLCYGDAVNLLKQVARKAEAINADGVEALQIMSSARRMGPRFRRVHGGYCAPSLLVKESLTATFNPRNVRTLNKSAGAAA